MGDSVEHREMEEPPKRRSTLLTVTPFIMANELCERLAFYGIQSNIINYFRLIGATNAGAGALTSSFSGACYSTPLLGGYLADTHWGRYKAILYLSIIYSLGMACLSLSTWVPGLHPDDGMNANGLHWTVLLVSLLLIAIGTGGIKPNVSTFGADQFNPNDPQDEKEKDSFFNFFYFFINVGALIASLVLVNVQEHQGWAIGFLIPAVAMLVAVVMFLLGTPLYKHIPPSGSALSVFLKITWLKVTCRMGKLGKPVHTGKSDHSTKTPLLADEEDTKQGGFTQQQIYDVQLVWRLGPVFLTMVVFWMVYNQMSTLFVLQGSVMDRNINIFGRNFKMAAATMTTFDTLIIIVLIPIYDRVLVPLVNLCGRRITPLQRMGWGYLVAVLSMVIASGIEFKRLQMYRDGAIVEGEINHGSQVVSISIMWQAFSYTFIGISEVFASIAGLEFFYDEAPNTMKSMVMSVYLLTTALGGYASGLAISGLNTISKAFGNEWIPDDLNKGRLDLFFLVVGGVMMVTTMLFLFISIKYEYRVVDDQEGKEPQVDDESQRNTESERQMDGQEAI